MLQNCAMPPYFELDSFRRAILALLLALLELLDLLVDRLVYSALQFRAVAKREQDLEPDEEGSQEDCLYEVVQQRRCSSLKLAVSDELGDPACDVDCAGPGVRGCAIRGRKVVCERGAANEDGSDHCTCDRFHEDV
jgi:hypothetical protein